MNKLKNIVVIAMVSLLFSSCAVSLPGIATDNPIGEKTGKASYKSILGFRPFKADIGIKKAAENGNISKVATVDQKVTTGFFVITHTTIVTGK